jgi:hypothetical protein
MAEYAGDVFLVEYAVDIFLEGFMPLLYTSLSASALSVGTKKLSWNGNRRSSSSITPTAPAAPIPGPPPEPPQVPAPVALTRINRQAQRDRAILLLGEPEAELRSPVVDPPTQNDLPPDEHLIVVADEDIYGDSDEDSYADSYGDSDDDSDADDDDDDYADRTANQGRRLGSISRAGFHPDEEESIRSSSPDPIDIPLPEDNSDFDYDDADRDAYQDRRIGSISRAGFRPDEEESIRSLSPDPTNIPHPEDNSDSDATTAVNQSPILGNEEIGGQQSETEVIPAPGPQPHPAGQLIDPSSQEGERILSSIRHFMHFPDDMDPIEVIINIAYDRHTIFTHMKYAMPYMLQSGQGVSQGYTNILLSPERDASYRRFVENLYIIDWKRIFEVGSKEFLENLMEKRNKDVQKAIELFRFLDEQRRLEGDERYYQGVEMERYRKPAAKLGAKGVPSPMRNVVTPDDVQDDQNHVEEQSRVEEQNQLEQQEERGSVGNEVHENEEFPTEEVGLDYEGEEGVYDLDMEEGVIHANLARVVINTYWVEDRLLDAGDDFHIQSLEIENCLQDLGECESSLRRYIKDNNMSVECDELSDLEFDDEE